MTINTFVTLEFPNGLFGKGQGVGIRKPMPLIIFNPTFDQISESTTSNIHIWSRMCNLQSPISRYQYPTLQTEKSFCICMESCCVTPGPYTANSKVPLSPTHKCLQ